MLKSTRSKVLASVVVLAAVGVALGLTLAGVGGAGRAAGAPGGRAGGRARTGVTTVSTEPDHFPEPVAGPSAPVPPGYVVRSSPGFALAVPPTWTDHAVAAGTAQKALWVGAASQPSWPPPACGVDISGALPVNDGRPYTGSPLEGSLFDEISNDSTLTADTYAGTRLVAPVAVPVTGSVAAALGGAVAPQTSIETSIADYQLRAAESNGVEYRLFCVGPVSELPAGLLQAMRAFRVGGGS